MMIVRVAENTVGASSSKKLKNHVLSSMVTYRKNLGGETHDWVPTGFVRGSSKNGYLSARAAAQKIKRQLKVLLFGRTVGGLGVA